MNNLELWEVNVYSKSYGKKLIETIHDIIQNLSFHPTKANPCVMMREHLETNSCEYIAVYVDDLYIARQKLEELSKPNASSRLREM